MTPRQYVRQGHRLALPVFTSELGVHLQVFRTSKELKVSLWGLLAKQCAKSTKDLKIKSIKASLRSRYYTHVPCHSCTLPLLWYLPPVGMEPAARSICLHEWYGVTGEVSGTLGDQVGSPNSFRSTAPSPIPALGWE